MWPGQRHQLKVRGGEQQKMVGVDQPEVCEGKQQEQQQQLETTEKTQQQKTPLQLCEEQQKEEEQQESVQQAKDDGLLSHARVSHGQQQLQGSCCTVAAHAAPHQRLLLLPSFTAVSASALWLVCVLLLLLQCGCLPHSSRRTQPFLNFLLQPAAAFNVQAQEAASMTTLSGLSATANQALRKLLNGKDLADIAGWTHRVTEKYPETGKLSFMQQPECPSARLDIQNIKLDTSSCEHQGNCLLEAITYFFFQLVDPAQNTKPQTDAEIISTNNFVFPHGIKTTDADSVKYLISLIGDLHSPSHWGSAGDNFGRNLIVEYHDGVRLRLTTFANYFEDALVDKTIKQRQYFWFSGWTHVNSIKGQYEMEKTLFDVNREKMFMRWAIENRAILCNDMYPQLHRTEKDARAVAAALGSAAVDDHVRAALKAHPSDARVPLYEISSVAEYLLFEVLRKRILLAGARTAVVMNHMLQVRQQKDLGKLREGTGVADVVDAVEPPLVVESRTLLYFKNFLFNVAIFIVIFFFFVYISRFYSSPPGHSPGARGAGDALSPTCKPAATAAVCTSGREGVEMGNIKNN